MPNLREKWENFTNKCLGVKEEFPVLKENLEKHADLQDNKDGGMPYSQYEAIRVKKEENGAEVTRLHELQGSYIASNEPVIIACAVGVHESKAAKMVDTSRFVDQAIMNRTSNWDSELANSARRVEASFAAYRSAVNQAMDAAEAYVVAREEVHAMMDANSSEDEVSEDESTSAQPTVNNQTRPNTGSLVNDFADTSTEMQSYINPED